MREDSLLSDVTLVCNDDKQIKAHKVILSSFSSLFKRMFVNNPHPQPIIFLKGVAFSDLDALLDFIYHGEASVAQENFSSFLETAADLEIEELSSFSNETENSKVRLGFIQNKTESFKSQDDEDNKLLDNHLSHEISYEKDTNINKFQKFVHLSGPTEDQETQIQIKPRTEEESEFEFVNHSSSSSYFKKKLADPHSYQCDDCDYKVFNSKHMEQHILETSHNSGRYKCRFCDVKTLVLKNLSKHTEEAHPVDRFRCDKCEYIGVSYQSIARHTYTIHQGVSFPCDQCTYKTNSQGSLKVHKERVHWNAPPVPCDRPTCDFQGTGPAVDLHVKRIHRPCKFCDYEPNSVRDKAMHKRTHTLNKLLNK